MGAECCLSLSHLRVALGLAQEPGASVVCIACQPQSLSGQVGTQPFKEPKKESWNIMCRKSNYNLFNTFLKLLI